MNEPAAPRRNPLATAEIAFGTAMELAAAALVLTEIVLLLAGVIARYVFNRPLVWSDELASMLFLWLAMLGAAIALRRAEHMRMTAMVTRAGRRWRPLLDAAALAATTLFLVLLLGPTFQYASEQAAITTPAMEISDAWRAAALPAGTLAMLLVALLRLLRCGRAGLVAALGVAALGLGFALAAPVFAGLGNYNLLIFFVAIVAALVFAGVPIAFAFGLAAFAYLALATDTPVAILVGRMDEGMSNLILLAVPLFVFLGLLIEMTGMARAMVTFLAGLLGHVRGGMHYVLVAGMYLVSGISGSKAADMAAIEPVLFPEMR
ncbi:MAG: TRAP transporter small permease subunit, partial [Rhodospirillales bacterium]|nr:TRAP transporter small permease subunit [Rhodospirillales bacterium]